MKICVFVDPYSDVCGQNIRFCPYTGECGTGKTRILPYFMQYGIDRKAEAKMLSSKCQGLFNSISGPF